MKARAAACRRLLRSFESPSPTSPTCWCFRSRARAARVARAVPAGRRRRARHLYSRSAWQPDDELPCVRRGERNAQGSRTTVAPVEHRLGDAMSGTRGLLLVSPRAALAARALRHRRRGRRLGAAHERGPRLSRLAGLLRPCAAHRRRPSARPKSTPRIPTGPSTTRKPSMKWCTATSSVRSASSCSRSPRSRSANRRDPAQPRVLPWVIVALLVLQALLGMWTVTLLLKPLIVTLHLLGGLTTLALLWWLALPPRTARAESGGTAGASARDRGMAVVLVAQISLGGWTSTNYAAAACADFPTCQGSLLAGDGFQEWLRAVARARHRL